MPFAPSFLANQGRIAYRFLLLQKKRALSRKKLPNALKK
jgi:hypothetical protein